MLQYCIVALDILNIVAFLVILIFIYVSPKNFHLIHLLHGLFVADLPLPVRNY